MAGEAVNGLRAGERGHSVPPMSRSPKYSMRPTIAHFAPRGAIIDGATSRRRPAARHADSSGG